MGHREHVAKEFFIVSAEPILPKMVIERNGHTYLYDRCECETHYLTEWHYYYYKLQK